MAPPHTAHTSAPAARSGTLAQNGHGHAVAARPGTAARPPASPVPSSSSSLLSRTSSLSPPLSPPGFGDAEVAPWHAFQRTASVKSRRYLEAAERIATSLTVDSIQRKLHAARAGTDCTAPARTPAVRRAHDELPLSLSVAHAHGRDDHFAVRQRLLRP
jgi:hypothetical protein